MLKRLKKLRDFHVYLIALNRQILYNNCNIFPLSVKKILRDFMHIFKNICIFLLLFVSFHVIKNFFIGFLDKELKKCASHTLATL